ncbi:putative RING finger protein nhl-1-like [Apostichopus japonicus]|uniref:Putative RING finger protein nhl-1-like n=1 Tax=Stichopus japonicus TaxID=307972 RepID=A0A2G8KNE8_STIJA|nr:putative RING finger protein nhl-1-like [Apostichopus japonicus]
MIIYTGLLDAIQYAQKVLEELLAAVSGARLEMLEVTKRYELRQTIDEKTKSLHRAREMVTYAISCSQYRPLNQSSSDAADNTANDITGNFEDTVTDGSGSETGQEATDNEINESLPDTNEPPTFKKISGIFQPHDVTTFKNQIFILTDGGIYAYDMEGNRIKRYQEDGFKPFAALSWKSLCVTDKKSKCVITFDESLKEKKRFGKPYMIEPAGITSCERENCIFVLTGRKRESAEVAKFTSNGKYLRCYCSNRLEDPWHIKKSSSDEFFISDFARKAVDVYSNDFSYLYTVNTYKHCRGMDIDNKGNIYVALRDRGYKAQYECIVRYIEPKQNNSEMLEESPKPSFWQNQNKSLDFVRGLHYYRYQHMEFLMVVDPGNKRLKVISL